MDGNKEVKPAVTGKLSAILQIGLLIAAVYSANYYNYILFHSLAEIVTVVIAFAIFAFTWNSRRFLDNNYILFIGIAYLFVGAIDLIHALAYKGMGVFNLDESNVATQLWLSARFVSASSFFIAPFFLTRKIRGKSIFILYLSIFALLMLSIFYFRIFPDAYLAGSGLTLFKKLSEYFIVFLFLSSIVFLFFKRKYFDKTVFNFLVLSLIISITSELTFTLYVGVYDFFNLIGHLLKIPSFYLSYFGIIEMGLMKPYRLLFRNLKDSETALRESEERYKTLVEFSPDALIVHDGRKIKYINRVGISLFSAKNEKEILKKSPVDLFHGDYKELFISRLKQLQGGLIETPLKDMQIKGLNGCVLDVEVKSTVMNFHGEPMIQTIIRDITTRKLAVEDASDHIVIIDPCGKIVYANKAAERMTGYFREELIGKTPSLWGDIILKKDGTGGQRVWEVINKEKPYFEGEVQNIRKNGEKYISDLHVSPVYDEDNEIEFYIAIERDITRLKEIDQAKTEFVSLASHQLRTPLSSISLSAELLLRDIAGPLDEKRRRYLEEIYNSTQRMTKLIDALLKVSRIELGTFKVKPEPINIINVIDEAISDIILQMKKKHLVFKKKYGGDLPIIKFDRNVLTMIIENLLANAIKYTPEKGEISLSVEKRVLDVLIKVTDTGCGIPKEEKHKIFSKLYRAENAKIISAEGAGLGLYIVKSIVEKTGSMIWFESEENKGTTFYVSIHFKEKK